ncbi:MAG: ribonuclease R [Gammaproteobacteria bacterium]|nr:ribonuclease R [Gammaproteobacteria bacterium]MYG97521.1 ribonuclease R [Gammaproteobacteria bacterium]
MNSPSTALDDLRPDLRAAIAGHGLPFAWPEAARGEARRLGGKVKPAEVAQRRDLRELPFVTIDGEDAKDFDDAVFARREDSGDWTLFVAIADVSHYVAAGGALDMEARERGTSAYFPDFVVPMLPEELSNELCSLKPRVDRLALACEIRIASDGEMLDYSFHETVIHSRARLTYNQVAAMALPAGAAGGQVKRQVKQKTLKRYEALRGHLDDLHELFKVLRKHRGDSGSIEFETVETRIVLDSDGAVRDIVTIQRNDAHRLIEECMLCANVAAARLLQESGLPALYRVHQGPDEEKLADLREYLRGLGLTLKGGGKPRPADYQRLLGQLTGRPDRELLQTLLIRSLSQAVYQPENIGHFGLNFPGYAHFTSPIRRYPDLLVHRAIRFLIRNRARRKIYPYNSFAMEELGEICSAAERRADAAGYQSVNWLKCEYMRDRVGEEFEGIVSAVTGFGLFVQLKDFHIDGLVHISALGDDYYHHDPVQHLLEGERKRVIYRLGDLVTVQVISVIPEEQKIELRLAQAGEEADHGGNGNKKNRNGKRGGRRNGFPDRGGKRTSPGGARRGPASRRRR